MHVGPGSCTAGAGHAAWGMRSEKCSRNVDIWQVPPPGHMALPFLWPKHLQETHPQRPGFRRATNARAVELQWIE